MGLASLELCGANSRRTKAPVHRVRDLTTIIDGGGCKTTHYGAGIVWSSLAQSASARISSSSMSSPGNNYSGTRSRIQRSLHFPEVLS
jgi:hypothetical protein